VRGGYDPDRAALILVDAMALGDRSASRKWGVSTRTVERYRARMSSDPALADLVREKKRGTERELAEMRIAFMREALSVLSEKIRSANVRSVAGALKIVGELHQTSMVIEGPVESADPEDPSAPEDGGGNAAAPSLSH